MLVYRLRNLFQIICRSSHTNKLYPTYKYSTKPPAPIELEIKDAPIKYSSSRAARHRAAESRYGGKIDNRLWYEGPVICLSLAIFLIYFTILREENDIDEDLGRSLYGRIDGLEEFQLKLSLKYNQEHNKDTKDIEIRLKEIELEKQAKAEVQANTR